MTKYVTGHIVGGFLPYVAHGGGQDGRTVGIGYGEDGRINEFYNVRPVNGFYRSAFRRDECKERGICGEIVERGGDIYVMPNNYNYLTLLFDKDENLVAVIDEPETETDKTYEEICYEIGWNDRMMLL